MHKSLWALFFAIFLALGLHADEFNKMATGEPELIQKGDEKAYCPICGMSLKMFYKTSHGVILKDGTAKQYCSIRCLAADYPAIESRISKILVTDVKSEKLIDAKSAFYVVGSKVPGTMSTVSKLAFGTEADAKAFVAENGGEVMNFDAAFAKAKASLANDVDEFIKKKQKGMYPMGEKIYNAKCEKEKIHLHDFNTISELKVSVKKTQVCGEVNEQELQAVSLYLWEIVRLEAHEHKTTIHVEKDEKCPVCGMFVYKYPKWAARMNYVENGKPVTHAFDGVKDLLKFYHAPSKWGNYTKHKDSELTLLVTDYYTGDAIDGMKAFYVVGSDVVGPMGKEFIPFKTLSSAQTFMKDHKGLQVVEFSKIDEALVYAQDK
ncbi:MULTISPECIES: nitrous oxide reductase accessory protein NosL [unclassified Sulfurospirillum]|uniref:nitrous oxide reductase accessory protein NosL n=1 Tax=unclassified Sulfurospirillum TaxID=2618290 RepID=UPI000505472F|nr:MULTISPECIES: nitrous oxide reductase accessory protein NosL [unclassified Sulfurospirillum]KFL34270.1 nitrous oxide reductase [Sulfurospirillum sp. SCADC]